MPEGVSLPCIAIFRETRLSRIPRSLHLHSTIHTMRWPPWSSDDDKKRVEGTWAESLSAHDWAAYGEPRQFIPILLASATTLVFYHGYRTYLRRIPDAVRINAGFFRRRSLYGKVTSVGDGDNFRIFHTPGGRLAGWGWAPGRKIPEERGKLKDNTVCTNSSIYVYL
jgi:hypothetical protein